MFDELESIRVAAQVLAVRAPRLKEPLLHACETLWTQMYEVHGPSEEFNPHVRALANRLTAGGGVESTLDAMDESAVASVARAIVQLAEKLGATNGSAA